jgi:pimeloyl-ACP methyl ester carboxylesterase
MNRREAIVAVAAAGTTLAGNRGATAAGGTDVQEPSPGIDGQYRSIEVDGVNIFYREAGKEGSPKLLLLHGFPASSHQYRLLIPLLADRFHVLVPDYPGFGYSDMPDPASYSYTFDNFASVVTSFLKKKNFTRFGMYAQDYGGPVGFRVVGANPDWLEWLIIQNTNAYEVGFTAAWDGLRGAYWKKRTPETEAPLAGFLEPETVKKVYTFGHPNLDLISPDNWHHDSMLLARPKAKQVQFDLFYDYRKNVELYPTWQTFLRERQPKTIIFWGQTDIFFTKEGGESFLTDLPKAEMHRLDSGHFAVEDCYAYIASHMHDFYAHKVAKG